MYVCNVVSILKESTLFLCFGTLHHITSQYYWSFLSQFLRWPRGSTSKEYLFGSSQSYKNRGNTSLLLLYNYRVSQSCIEPKTTRLGIRRYGRINNLLGGNHESSSTITYTYKFIPTSLDWSGTKICALLIVFEKHLKMLPLSPIVQLTLNIQGSSL